MFELLGNVGGLMESTRLTAEEDAFMESFVHMMMRMKLLYMQQWRVSRTLIT